MLRERGRIRALRAVETGPAMSETTMMGGAIKPNLDWMRQQCSTDQWDAVLARLDDEQRRQIELLNGALRYPVSLFDAVSRAFADVAYGGDPRAAGAAFMEMGRHTAAEHLSGVYSIFLKVSSPGGTLKKVPQMFGRLYEGAVAEAELLDTPGGPKGRMTVHGLGGLSYSGPRLCGWAESALAKTGAAGIRVVELGWQAGRNTSEPLVFELYWA